MGLGWDPGNAVLRCLRDHQSLPKSGWFAQKVHKRWIKLRHRFWSILSGSDIDLGVRVGVGVQLPHPNGVVIHPDAEIGDGCMIMQQVTLGQLATRGAPRLGRNVYVGAGAKVLGGVVVGDKAAIGANAVVLCDVPAGYTAVGTPAVCRPSKSRKPA
jgi:serine O-acetyltransferase